MIRGKEGQSTVCKALETGKTLGLQGQTENSVAVVRYDL